METKRITTRRNAIVRFGAVPLSLAAMQRSFIATGQEATPPSSTEAVPDLIAQWGAAWTAGDPEMAFAALYTGDAVWRDAPTGLESAPGEVDAFVGMFISQISDLQMKLRSGFRTDTQGAAEWDLSFHYTGQLPGAPAGAGQPVAWHGVTVFTFAGEKIQRSTDYYDSAPFLAALGLIGPPPSATPAG